MSDKSTIGSLGMVNISIMAILFMVFAFYGSYKVFCVCSILLLISLFLIRKGRHKKQIQPHQKAVLITGCDTGFGNLLAKRLDSRGFQVFASCLFPDGEGANGLRDACSSRLQVLSLDVTKDDSVTSAFNFVKENLGSNVLWAVVNNAGISKGFSFDFSTIQHFKDTFDVNTLGPVRVTKAFLPLLKKSKGRIINVSSIGGRVSVTDTCAYIMSKHAVIALSECLSLEMIPWGIRVISIEPEMFSTPIMDGKNVAKRYDNELKEINEDILTAYGEKYVNGLREFILRFADRSSDDLDKVVDAMESAISEVKPSHVFKPNRNLPTLVLRYIIENIPHDLYVMFHRIVQYVMGYPVLQIERKKFRKNC